ncbi:MAG: diguanylate cyclase [Nitrospirae bacterium]|nr:diguanylate cyclase [Nitrospirota bacterium]
MNKIRIMIVEDEMISSTYIQSILEQLGYIVTSVVMSADEAIKQTDQDRPELILMDIHIKGSMDGIDTAHEIRMRFDIPIVYLTAHADASTVERAKITEPFGYVIKPVEAKELKTSIEIALYKHKMETKLKSLAHYDYLTGLPNRTLFFDRFEQALKQAKRNNKDVALLMIDLDGFKCINDRMGHDTGDIVLIEIAKRLKHQIRDSDTLARFGGDEFMIILTNLSEAGVAETLALKIIVAIGKPFHFQTPYCAIGASIGISFYPSDGYDIETLLKKADAAMYRAKENGKNNYQLFHDTNKQTAGDIKTILSHSLQFVLQHTSGWGHSEWMEFLIALKEHGVFISKTVEPHVGAIIETLRKFYMLPQPKAGGIEEIMSLLCNETANFIVSNNGIWTIQDWESFLEDINSKGITLDNQASLLLLSIIEAAKSLYILCC